MRREQRMDSCSKEPLLLINAAMLQMSHSTDHLHANVSTTLPVPQFDRVCREHYFRDRITKSHQTV